MTHIRRTTALFSLLLLSATAAFADPVKTTNGLVEGSTEKDLRVYRGIPFAAPPVGDLRWKAPQPAQNWSGVKPADLVQVRVSNLNDGVRGVGDGKVDASITGIGIALVEEVNAMEPVRYLSLPTTDAAGAVETDDEPVPFGQILGEVVREDGLRLLLDPPID